MPGEVSMIPSWLEILASVSLIVSFGCSGVLVVLVVRRPQPMAVMNFVWPITALYLGPIAIWWYWTLAHTASNQMPATAKMRPFWKTILIEATHCGAGCVIGDVIAEFTVAATGAKVGGSVLFAEFGADYVLAFLFGIAFQYFAIAPMKGLSLLPGIRAAIQADGVSLTAFEIGLFAWMFVMTQLPFHHELTPLQVTFWFLMQVGMVIGYVTSYPANWLLVRIGIKEPM
jgi:hypothetical protein